MVVWTKLKCVNSEPPENFFNSPIWSERHKLKIIFLNGEFLNQGPADDPIGPSQTSRF